MTIPAGETWNLGNVTLAFAPGKKLIVKGTLNATGTTFTASDPASGWGGLRQTSGTATLSGGAVLDGSATVLGGTFTLDASVIQDGQIYASGAAAQVYVQNGSRIDGSSTWGVFAENGADAFIEGTDTVIEGSTFGGVRSRGFGTTITFDDDATSFQNGDGTFSDLYGDVVFAANGSPVDILDNSDGLWSETAASVLTGSGGHRIIDNSSGTYAYDVFGMDGSYTDADYNYWGTGVTSSNDLDVLDGDATILIDPVLTSDPGSGGGARVANSGRDDATGLPYVSALGTDTVQGWIEAAEEATARGDADGAVDAVQEALGRADAPSGRQQAWGAASRLAIRLQEMASASGASAWARLAATVRARLHTPDDAPWARRTLAIGALMHPGRGISERSTEARGHLTALRALPERADLAVITARLPQREGSGATAPLSHAAFADLMEIRLALEAGDADGARSALAALAAVDSAQAEAASVGAKATFPTLDVAAALAEGTQEGRRRQAEDARQATAEGLTAHPNPTTGALRLRFGLEQTRTVEVAVFDGLGRRVAEVASGEREAGVHTEAVDLSGLPAGVYLVRMTVEPADGGAPRAEVRRIAVVR